MHLRLFLAVLPVPVCCRHVVCLSDGCYISKGYDATTHFESTEDDVLDLYRRITGARARARVVRPLPADWARGWLS